MVNHNEARMGKKSKIKNDENLSYVTEALAQWQDQVSGRLDLHPTNLQLDDFLTGLLEEEDKRKMIRHLSYCTQCRRELWNIEALDQEESILDIAAPKSASSREKGSFSVLTDCKRYRISLKRVLNQKDKGVVTLKIEPQYREKMEGKKLVVFDQKGTHLIRSKVFNGETPGRIVDVNEIDWQKLIVREDIS